MNDLNIRRSTAFDRRALERLAARDSRPLAESDYLVAETGGQIVAAVPLGGGTAIADPFRPTAEIVAMLELQADAPPEPPQRGLLRRVARPLSRAAAQA